MDGDEEGNGHRSDKVEAAMCMVRSGSVGNAFLSSSMSTLVIPPRIESRVRLFSLIRLLNRH